MESEIGCSSGVSLSSRRDGILEGPGEVFSQWLRLFEGTYDARNFARLEEGKNPIRTILSCTPWIVDGRTVGFEIVGEAFLWNQVRRTAMALHLLALGEITEDDVRNAIDHPEIEVDFGVAPRIG